MLVAIVIDLKISANPSKCPSSSPCHPIAHNLVLLLCAPHSPPLSTAYLCKPKAQPHAHALALHPQQEEMGTAQEELGAAGPRSNPLGDGVMQVSASLQAMSLGPPTHTETLTEVDSYVTAHRQVTGSCLHTEAFSGTQFPPQRSCHRFLLRAVPVPQVG